MRFALSLLFVAGCHFTVKSYMRVVHPPEALQATNDSGLVVFVQPSHWGGVFAQAVLDDQGHFVGRPQAATHFAVASPPGPHVFTVWGENTDAIFIDVAPGKTYFVEVSAQPGFWSGPRFQLYAISPRTSTWGKRESWLQSTTQTARDPALGDYVAEHAGEVPERLKRGREWLEKYRGTAEEPRHFIAANDGI
jgi:hypothetical protein